MPCTHLVVILILSFFLGISVSASSAHFVPCSEPFFQLINHQKNLTNCKKLTTLGAEFGWSIDNQEIHIIFGARLYEDYGWLAWGVNPDKRPHMVGTRAIIGVRHDNGSSIVETYNITADTKLGCKLTPTRFDSEAKNEVRFRNISMNYLSDLKYFTIQATLVLPGEIYNTSELNHVWQVGYELDDTIPRQHPRVLQNVDSTETINLVTGRTTRHVGRHRRNLRMIHGILNIVGWGVFLPSGVIVARYFKYPLKITKWWFSLHVGCQIIGYILGTSSWIIGLCLGSASKFYIFRTHRLYAMFIFAFTTIQSLALRLKPGKQDEYRNYWNMYHHFLGYGLLVVIAINIFVGIDILKPGIIWTWVYCGILAAFVVVVAVLEIFTWVKFNSERRKSTGQQDATANTNTTMGGAPQLPPPPPSPSASDSSVDTHKSSSGRK